jgi:hypothetical protein
MIGGDGHSVSLQLISVGAMRRVDVSAGTKCAKLAASITASAKAIVRPPRPPKHICHRVHRAAR